MQSYIKEAIETFGEDVSIVVTSPAKSRLFDVTEGSEKFQKKKPQLSLNSGKAVVDNEEVTTRYWNCHIFSLRSSEIPRYTWLGKTETIYQILSQNIGYDRVIGADNLYEVLTYLDTSYATHDDMKGCTGGCMKFGWGLIHEKSSNQKLNTKILTESKVVGSLDMYTEHQVYKVKINQLMQDNMSSIKMENNSRNSCTGNSRHINIRYLFVKERVDKKEIGIFSLSHWGYVSRLLYKTIAGKAVSYV